ncbi:MAG: hypothetical protein JXR76_30600 [Deltaproteobacteria bacterium]|nr:hypothetical protein [Deltaproteobacteria bacterium]
MKLNDNCCTIVPYFNVAMGHIDDFKALGEKFVEKTQDEEKCLFYGFSFHGGIAHCREGYADAEGVLAHLENVGELLQQALEISELSRFEIHGPRKELEKLRGPLASLNPDFYELEIGFRK